MIIVRLAKIAMVAAIALFASLVAFGNITDYGTNLAFVQHVLSMDTIFERSTIRYRAIDSPALQQLAYAAIIATEALTAVLCWVGAFMLLRHLRADAGAFNRAKAIAVAGLTLGFLLWQVGFMTIGGEWFGMWQSKSWNGVPDAFRFVMVITAVLIFLVLPDDDTGGGHDRGHRNDRAG
jgi:predicted small integral membrane protein